MGLGESEKKEDRRELGGKKSGALVSFLAAFQQWSDPDEGCSRASEDRLASRSDPTISYLLIF